MISVPYVWNWTCKEKDKRRIKKTIIILYVVNQKLWKQCKKMNDLR